MGQATIGYTLSRLGVQFPEAPCLAAHAGRRLKPWRKSGRPVLQCRSSIHMLESVESWSWPPLVSESWPPWCGWSRESACWRAGRSAAFLFLQSRGCMCSASLPNGTPKGAPVCSPSMS